MSISVFAFVCYVLSLVVYVTYVIVCKLRYKEKMDCISSTYYLNERKWVFTLFIAFISFFLLPSWLEISGESYAFLAFLSVVSMLGVGIFPRYLEDDRAKHIASVFVSAIISIIWNVVSGVYLPILIGVALLLLSKLLFPKKDLTLMAEIVAFLNIYASILLTAFNLTI